MNERNKGKIKAAEIIAGMVQERLKEAKENDDWDGEQSCESILNDIKVYKMIVEKSDEYGPRLVQQEPGCDY